MWSFSFWCILLFIVYIRSNISTFFPFVRNTNILWYAYVTHHHPLQITNMELEYGDWSLITLFLWLSRTCCTSDPVFWHKHTPCGLWCLHMCIGLIVITVQGTYLPLCIYWRCSKEVIIVEVDFDRFSLHETQIHAWCHTHVDFQFREIATLCGRTHSNMLIDLSICL